MERGYTRFLEKYFTMKEGDIETIYELIKESIPWANYLSEIKNLLKVYCLEKTPESNKTVEEEIKALKSFQKHLEIQSKYCNLIHKETMEFYKKSVYRMAFKSSM